MNLKSEFVTRARERGAALITVLVLLLVMTLLGLVSVRGTLLEERMSGGLYDRNLAFQAAEAALREGEQLAQSRPDAPPNGCTLAGICAAPISGDNEPPIWHDEDIWGAAPVATSNLTEDGEIEMEAPRFLVELIAENVVTPGSCPTSVDISETQCTGNERRYRITARSQQGDRSAVVLQSIYAVP